MRGFGVALEPLRERPPAPAVAAAARWRRGARRRASRQMKSEMPPSTMIAPTAITTASVPVNPPPEEVEPELVTVEGVAEVVVAGAGGVAAGVCGKPGERGLPGLGEPEPWAWARVGALRPSDSAHSTIAMEAGRITRTCVR